MITQTNNYLHSNINFFQNKNNFIQKNNYAKKQNLISFGSGFGIKVCGVCDEASVGAIMSAAYAAKTDQLIIGMLIGITHESKEKLTDKQAVGIIKKTRKMSYQLDRPVQIACVTHCTEAKTLIKHIETIDKGVMEGKNGLKTMAKKLNRQFGMDTRKLTEPIFNIIQIHDDMPLEEIKKVKEKYPKCKILKAVHVPKTGETYNLDALKDRAVTFAKQDYIDGLLLDSANLATNQIGGTGLVNDWDIAKELIKEVHKKTGKPVGLAGGIDPTNVKDAIKATNADLVDGNTGWRHDRKNETWIPIDPKKSGPKDPFAVYHVLTAFKNKVSPFYVRHMDRDKAVKAKSHADK